MANTRSARKRIRSNETKRIRNRTIRSAVRTKVTRARRVLLGAAESTDTEAELREAISALDRAAEKGVLHPNNARRRASRLAAMAFRLRSAAQGAEADQVAARSAAAGGAKGRTAKGAARKPAAGKTRAAKAPAAKAAVKPAAGRQPRTRSTS